RARRDIEMLLGSKVYLELWVKVQRDWRNKVNFIRQIGYVERDSQKGIVIGKGGKKLKEVGNRARRDIEMLLGSKVYLELWVKVQRDWRNKVNFIRQIGYVERD
ncbi:KH domain-containing protein, partial [Staphylococcus aureus]|uniref:KH domain-containing protein n=1 Tax=Staphylococcus aureus TaxID=1280 RepID=UPI00210D33B2